MSEKEKPFNPLLTDVRVKTLRPGMWQDGNGMIHFNIDEMVTGNGMELTEENRKVMRELAREVVALASKIKGHKPPHEAVRTSKDATYALSPEGTSITCLICGMTSYNSEDVRKRYCGKCNRFHES
jgi:hypothetical protein